MAPVRRNIIANLLGGVLLTVLTVVITPMQINILGIEAYGVVGFITTIQSAFTAFDLGLSSTLTRELAADGSSGKARSVELVRTASTIYWMSACLIGLMATAAAGPLAARWFHMTAISADDLARSLRVVALYLGLRWPVALYIGVLTGLQRLDVMNAIKVGAAALRLVGGVVVLMYWRTLHAYLLWTVLNALVEVAAYWNACRLIYPLMHSSPGISAFELRRIWRFSASMYALAILSVVIVQMDRLMISRMLTLKLLGLYSLAYNASAVIPALIGAVGSATMPAFAAAYLPGSTQQLTSRYLAASRFMLFLITLVVACFVFYGEPILAVWVNAEAAISAARPLAILSLGFWGSAVVACAYNAAVAAGRLKAVLKISFVSTIPYVVSLYWLIEVFGIDGAALAWLLLNACYVAFILPHVHRHLLDIPLRSFFKSVVIPLVLLSAFSFGFTKLLAHGLERISFNSPQIAALLVAGSLYVGIGYLILGPEFRSILGHLSGWFKARA
jgi:O-antigen/teichoic acid export membrane protein